MMTRGDPTVVSCLRSPSIPSRTSTTQKWCLCFGRGCLRLRKTGGERTRWEREDYSVIVLIKCEFLHTEAGYNILSALMVVPQFLLLHKYTHFSVFPPPPQHTHTHTSSSFPIFLPPFLSTSFLLPTFTTVPPTTPLSCLQWFWACGDKCSGAHLRHESSGGVCLPWWARQGPGPQWWVVRGGIGYEDIGELCSRRLLLSIWSSGKLGDVFCAHVLCP